MYVCMYVCMYVNALDVYAPSNGYQQTCVYSIINSIYLQDA